MCLMATPSGEAVQTLASATSKRGLDREARAALLRVRTRHEMPQGQSEGTNLRQQPRLWDNYPKTSPGPLTEQRLELS